MRYLAVKTLTLLALLIAQSVAAQSFKSNVGAGVDTYNEEDYATALRHITPLGEQGHARARHNLGVMYGDFVICHCGP